MKRILLLCLTVVSAFVYGEAIAQQRTITGRVTSAEDGSPLPGVNVVLKGTTDGTITDAEGNYTLSVPQAGGTLSFTFIGLKVLDVEIGSRSSVDVSLEQDVTQLSEVIVTGYGVEQKRDLTGSVSSVKGEKINNLPVQSFDRAIQGRLAGVQVMSTSGAPGGAINIVVRGAGSLSNNTPLYIVDGVQIQAGAVSFGGSNNALAGVNPQDIESIEVLKDAAASAIYGAQAANGVVIITTKRGKSGKTNVDVNYQIGYVQPMNLYDVMNAQQFATIKEAAYINAGKDPGLNSAIVPGQNNSGYAIYGNPNDPSTLTNYDWVDAVFRTGKLQSINVSAQGGDDKTLFYVSGAYETQEGQVVSSDWSRASLRTNFEHKTTDKLSFKINLGLTRQNNNGTIADGNFINGPFQSAFVSQPNSPAFNAETGYFNLYPAHLPVTGSGHNFNYNIMQGASQERREGITVQTMGNISATYKFFPWLTGLVSAGMDLGDTEYVNERPQTIPAFAASAGQVTEINRRLLNWNGFGTLNFAKKFNDAHNVSMIVGFEYKDNYLRQQTAQGFGYPYPEIRVLDLAAVNQDVAGFNTGYKRAGAFVRANYDFNAKYYVNATFRRDGNSRFGESVRFGNFWAVGGGWRISEESFVGDSRIISDLKLRGSYGVLGNAEGLSDFGARTLYGGGIQYLGGAGTRQTIGNDLLTWEEAWQTNIGIDYALFNSRVYGSVDVFREDTKNQLLTQQLPFDSGYGSVRGNVGSVRNDGIEVEIGAVIFDKGGFQYRSTFNATFIKNEVTDLGPDQTRVSTPFGTVLLGEPIGVIEGVPYAGVNPANGKAMWLDINNEPVYVTQTADRRIIGNTLPKSYGGWTNSFSFKGINLEIFFQGQMGADAFLGDMYNLSYAGSSTDNQLVSELKYWKQPGDITNTPAPFEGGSRDSYDQRFPGFAPSRFVGDASYIRLKQITLGYDIPAALLSKIKLRKINVFAQALNLVTWTKFPGIDPEVVNANNFGNVSTYGNYPNGKQITFGINIGL
jgi:TonB-dependent starch-binding outer membrane protein SusC